MPEDASDQREKTGRIGYQMEGKTLPIKCTAIETREFI